MKLENNFFINNFIYNKKFYTLEVLIFTVS